MTSTTRAKSKSRRPHTAGSLTASTEARRLAAAILEVLAGVRTPTDAARAVGTSVPRYYQLEQRAIQGLLSACEPRTKGRQPNEARQIARLERDLQRLRKECDRQQALARVAQRAVGLSQVPPPAAKNSGNGTARKRVRRPAIRALRAVAGLRADSSSEEGRATVQPPTVDQGTATGERATVPAEGQAG